MYFNTFFLQTHLASNFSDIHKNMLTSRHMVVNCYCARGFGTIPKNQSIWCRSFVSKHFFMKRRKRASFLMDFILLYKPRLHVYLMNIRTTPPWGCTTTKNKNSHFLSSRLNNIETNLRRTHWTKHYPQVHTVQGKCQS